jgi:hypothetical protein
MFMTCDGGFSLHLATAKELVARISGHSSTYEAAVRTESIPEAFSIHVRMCILAIESALDALLAEVESTLQVQMSHGPSWRKRLLDGLGAQSSSQQMMMNASLAVADADGWLSQMEALRSGAVQLDLRRETAAVTFTLGRDGIPLLEVRAKSGESLSMLAPLLLGDASSPDGSRSGYYSAVFPEGREAVAFLDRCVRGAEHLASVVRKNIDALGR